MRNSVAFLLTAFAAIFMMGDYYPPSGNSTYSLTPQQYFAAQQQAFVATTKFMSIPNGDSANITICNGAATGGKSLYIYRRRFDAQVATATTPLTYGGLSSPAAISSSSTYSSATAAASTTGNNALKGGPTSALMTMTFAVGTAQLGGTVSAQSTLTTGGGETVVDEPTIVPPGVCSGQFVTIPSGLTGGPYNVGFTLFWWEQ